MERSSYLELEWEGKNFLSSLFQVVGASLFIGLLAQIRIPLYFTPVPLTGQTLAVMMTGAFLGSRKGALAVLCYLMQGCLGLPVWAGGTSGLIHFVGPTGGYLIGFVVQAYLIGLLFEQNRFNRLPAFFKIWIPSIIQLVIGTLWLAKFTSFQTSWFLGFFPFIIGDAIKVGITSFAIKKHAPHLSI